MARNMVGASSHAANGQQSPAINGREKGLPAEAGSEVDAVLMEVSAADADTHVL